MFPFVHLHAGNSILLSVNKPGFVPADSIYQLSVLFSNKLMQFQKTNFYLLMENNAEVKRVTLKSGPLTKELRFARSNFNSYYGKAVKISIEPEQIFSLRHETTIVFVELKSRNTVSTEIAFALEHFNDSKLEESCTSFDSEDTKLPIVNVNFYKPQTEAGQALVLNKDADISLMMNNKIMNEKLLFNFWMKPVITGKPFFNIVNEDETDTISSFGVNSNYLVSIPRSTSFLNPKNIFLAKGSWNYISYIIDYEESIVELYINGRKAFSMKRQINRDEFLNFKFKNKSSIPVKMDNFSLIDFGNNINAVNENMHYNSFNSDSSIVLYFNNFDYRMVEDYSSDQNISISSSQLNFRRSDAPIFSRVPDLKIYSYESFNEIVWSNSDDASVDYYEMQRSVNGSDFHVLSTTYSTNNPDKTYTAVDEKNNMDEIVYYRIKQLNKNGQTLYSGVFKVGQAKRDSFILNQNYPNPFNPVTNTTVEVIYSSEFSIVVYDLVGNKIIDLYKGTLAEGVHTFSFDGSSLPSGIYFFEVTTPHATKAVKMILAK
ncbi:MAG: T9SS type A sorting domain-containing protein [Melioribacteraceae bacterium]|nr:T9SS type A sorting domain-containing protein [Melioribacteraceae bacterium]